MNPRKSTYRILNLALLTALAFSRGSFAEAIGCNAMAERISKNFDFGTVESPGVTVKSVRSRIDSETGLKLFAIAKSFDQDVGHQELLPAVANALFEIPALVGPPNSDVFRSFKGYVEQNPFGLKPGTSIMKIEIYEGKRQQKIEMYFDATNLQDCQMAGASVSLTLQDPISYENFSVAIENEPLTLDLCRYESQFSSFNWSLKGRLCGYFPEFSK